jgi:nitrite reductase (NADH) large subunit
VRPRDNLAAWGLATHPNGGFVVNQFLETSDSHVYAIGECAVVAGIPCGTVSPGYAMAECLTSTLLDRPSAFTPPPSGVRLKIAGLPVAMAGRGPEDGSPPAASASHGGAHRSIHVEDGRIVGATVVGEWREWERVEDAVRRRRPLAAWRIDRFVRGETMWPDELSPRALPGETIVCACNNVTLGAIEAARSAGCRSVAAVAACTHATTTCGACVPMIEGILHPETPLLTSTARRTSLLVIGALSLLVVGTVAGARPLLERLRPEKLALLDHFLRRPWEQQLTGFGLLGLLLMALLMPLRRILWRRAAPGPGWRVVHALVGVLAVAALVTHTGLRLGVNLNRTLSLAFLSLAALGGLAALAMSGRRRPGWSRFLHEALFWPAFALLGLHILVVYYF